MDCFNTQPPEGGWLSQPSSSICVSVVSTHSRPKAAGVVLLVNSLEKGKFQHTAARRRLALPYHIFGNNKMFQHTAARRRLAALMLPLLIVLVVSTHSRPKAAGSNNPFSVSLLPVFQHTAARRRLANWAWCNRGTYRFQHTAARRRLGQKK